MDHRTLCAPTLLGLLLTLGGCSLTPDYQVPAAPIADHWPQLSAENEPTRSRHSGYQAFINDPQLLRVVDVALSSNRSLRQTLLDIETARAKYQIQHSDRLPGVNAGASGNRAHVPADLSTSGREGVSATYQAGLNLPEYELDLFGRVKNLSDAALEQFLAAKETAESARIALIADTVQGYLNYESTLRQLSLTQQTLESREASVNLVRQQLANGTATALDYQEALGLEQQARADLESNERNRRQARNALTLLIGTPDAPALLPDRPSEQQRIVQDLAPGAPSGLLLQRPDILASEHLLKARHADIGAARAAFFPRITLTGSLGTSSTEMSHLFDGGSRAWSFVPALSVPIFDGGRNRANLELAQVRKEAAVVSYEQAVQTAFREVADALDSVDTLRHEVKARTSLAGTSSETLKLAQARYQQGIDNHLRYLDAQRASFNNQLTLIRVRTDQQLALVALYRSLGGAWY